MIHIAPRVDGGGGAFDFALKLSGSLTLKLSGSLTFFSIVPNWLWNCASDQDQKFLGGVPPDPPKNVVTLNDLKVVQPLHICSQEEILCAHQNYVSEHDVQLAILSKPNYSCAKELIHVHHHGDQITPDYD